MGISPSPENSGGQPKGQGLQAPAPGTAGNRKAVPSPKPSTALIEKSTRTHCLFPHSGLENRGQDGYNKPVVRSAIAVLSGLSLVQGRGVFTPPRGLPQFLFPPSF